MALTDGVVGVLLAGGKASRMGGGDKGLRMLKGQPILERIIARFRPQVSSIVVNANGDEARFTEFGLPVMADLVQGQPGPLAGIHAGIEWARANAPDASHVATVPTDTPFFPSGLVETFLSAATAEQPFCIAQSETGTHPVIGLWPVSLADALERSLESGERRVGQWTETHGACKVFFPPLEREGRRIDPFFNINTPEDLAAAETFLAEAAQ